MGLFGKSKKEREKEYMNKLDVPSCLKENFELITLRRWHICWERVVVARDCRQALMACGWP